MTTEFRGLSWGPVFAGSFVALAVQATLSILGIAAGIISVPAGAGMPGEVDIGVKTWLVVSSVISLFVGGMVTGRLAGYSKGLAGGLHGLVVWGLVTIATLGFSGFGWGLYLGGMGSVLGSGLVMLHSSIGDAAVISGIVSGSAYAAFAGWALSAVSASLGGYIIAPKSERVPVSSEVKEEKKEFPRAA